MRLGLSSTSLECGTTRVAGEPLALVLDPGLSIGAQRLIWQEFFASRGRGLGWETHFPWAVAGKALCSSAIGDPAVSPATNGVVAALLVRRAPVIDCAMIGCVCVDTAYRGLGLSKQLIDLAAERLRLLGINQMLLWTGKPRVYERAGFVVAAQERRLTLRHEGRADSIAIEVSPWPSGIDHGSDGAGIGLPPFATAGWRASAPDAKIIFVDTPMGPALLDQSGPPQAVLRTMFAVRPGDWSATLCSEHPLRHAAIAEGMCVDEQPGPFTMHRSLGGDVTSPASVPPALRI